MELQKEHWTKDDIKPFQDYLTHLGQGDEKAKWEQNITRTNLPCLAVQSNEVKKVINQIAKGNYIDFLDLWIMDNLTNTYIVGNLICKIKEFDTMEKYLSRFAQEIDNWASCDSLKFNITSQNREQFWKLSSQYLNSPKTFVKRVGLRILFKFLDDNHIDGVLEQIKNLQNQTEYYVNMCISWLLCEAFIKQREKTLEFLKNNKLNPAVINVAVQKCRDSFRVSKQDKEMLLTFKCKSQN